MASGMAVGDIVWAKMKGYPWWPSKIGAPKDNVKKPFGGKQKHFVEFFGSNTYAWISDDCIKPFDKHKEEYSKCSLASFKLAMAELKKYTASSEDSDSSSTGSVYDEMPYMSLIPNFSPLMSYSSSFSESNDGTVQRSRLTSIKKGKYSKSKGCTTKTNGFAPKKKPLKVNRNHVLKSIKTAIKRSVLNTQISASPAKKRGTKRQRTEPSSTASNKMFAMTSFSPCLNYDSPQSQHHSGIFSSSLHESIVKMTSARQEERYVCFGAEHSDWRIGFLGLGNMGGTIVEKILRHQVTSNKINVWNRSPEKITRFSETKVNVCETPGDVVAMSDITFSCVSNPIAAKEVVFGNSGVLKEICVDKCYVEMTSIDPDTSSDIAEAITKKGGHYLEAPLLGSKQLAEDSKLIILSAGQNTLFDKCKPYFRTIGNTAYYLGCEVGKAAKLNLIFNMMMGTSLASLLEAMTLANRVNISHSDLLNILQLGPLCCPLFIAKAQEIVQKTPTHMSLQNIQKDLQLALQLGDKICHPLVTTAAANEAYKHEEQRGFKSFGISAIHRKA